MIASHSIPALVALIFKFILLGYVARSPVRNVVTTLFMALLVVFTLLNLDEFFFLNYLPMYGLTPVVKACGYTYIALWGPAIAILLHLSLVLSLDATAILRRPVWIFLLYAPIAPLECLLWYSDKLVLNFEPFLYSVMRVPGPWYWIAEGWAVLLLAATLAILMVGARSSRAALLRVRNRMWLLALSPMILLAIYMIVSHHLGWRSVTFPVHTPIAMTFFLLITTYATHERPRRGGFYRFLYRLFDIESYLPWCRAYRRKTALYNRIHMTIAEIGDSRSIQSIVGRVSQALQCPTVFVAGVRSAPVRSGGAQDIAQFPREALRYIDRIVIAHQVARSMPLTHTLMVHHRVAAIIPFFPCSRAASWMLFGESFNEQVYTPADFDVVRGLINRLADHMLDDQIHRRTRLHDVRREVRALRRRLTGSARRRKDVHNAAAAGPREPALNADIARVRSEMLMQTGADGTTLDQHVAAFERGVIAKALEHTSGNQAKAAELLGLRPNTLHYKIRRYGISGLRKEA